MTGPQLFRCDRCCRPYARKDFACPTCPDPIKELVAERYVGAEHLTTRELIELRRSVCIELYEKHHLYYSHIAKYMNSDPSTVKYLINSKPKKGYPILEVLTEPMRTKQVAKAIGSAEEWTRLKLHELLDLRRVKRRADGLWTRV